MTRRRWLILGVVTVLALLAGLAVAWHLAKQPAADIHNGASAFFSDPPTTTQTEATPPATTHKKQPFQGEPPWPMYGYNVARTRDASAFRQINPPFHTVWKRKTFGILEYPPSFADGILYLATDSGWTQAIDARTGDPVWTRRLGAGLANEAALSTTMMYVGSHDGHVYALSRKTGKIIWKTKVAARSSARSSTTAGASTAAATRPGAGDGRRDRPILWTFQASGEVKSGLSTADGRLYFGDYSSTMYALRISSGKLLWRTHTAGLSSGYRSGCSTRRRPPRTGASTSATPTASSTRSWRRTGRSPGRTRSAAGSTAARPCTTGWCSRRATPVSSRR